MPDRRSVEIGREVSVARFDREVRSSDETRRTPLVVSF
jgi:hypothetical protein